MKKKDLLIFFTFVVAPLGFFAAGVYYGPKLVKWYGKKGKSLLENGEANSDLVELKSIDETNKKITLSLNKNPDMAFSYRTGGVPMAQIINVPGIDSNEMALRYVDGKFSVTDGAKVLF